MSKNPPNLKKPDVISPSEALDVYIKLLYSKEFYNQNKIHLKNNPNKFNNFFNFINLEDLEFEQYARIRNLKSFILKNDLINTVTSQMDQELLIEKYCNWEQFFCFKGRSLLEDFCLFLYEYFLNTNNAIYAEAVKVQGIISGITKSKESPWNSIRKVNTSNSHEKFNSHFHIKFINDEIKILDNHKDNEVTISVDKSGLVEIFSQELI